MGSYEIGSAGCRWFDRGWLLVWHARWVTWRAARDRRRTLERELAAYSSPSQRADLLATLDRYPDGVTHELRDILTRPALSPSRPGRWPAMGRF